MIRLTIILCLLSGVVAQSATINVSSYGDGSAAYSNALSAYTASANGDTILFPLNGNATWTNSLTVSKAIYLNGNGATLQAGSTLLNGFFYLTSYTNTTDLTRIAYFTLDTVTSVATRRCIFASSVALTKLRIDHNTFTNGYTQVEIEGAFGVIDHNLFINPLQWIQLNGGLRYQQDALWADLTPGTSNAIFVEDNRFVLDANWTLLGNGNGFDASAGGKIVVRFNEWDLDNNPTAGTLATIGFHGNAGAGPTDGCAYWEYFATARRSPALSEIYSNSMHGKRIDWMFTSRGGSSLIFSNSITHTDPGTPRLKLREEEYEVVASGQFYPYRTNWPAEDQIHNTFVWSNLFKGVLQQPANFYVDPATSFGIQQDRDYFLHPPQATGGYESFTGSPGSSDTYPTDGITYPTLGTMVFNAVGANAYYGYTPYTYPHPLIGYTPEPPVVNTPGFSFRRWRTGQ